MSNQYALKKQSKSWMFSLISYNYEAYYLKKIKGQIGDETSWNLGNNKGHN